MLILWHIFYIDSIGIQIKPLFDEKNIENNCNKRSCFEYGLNSTITEALLPRETMSMTEHKEECSIQLGCSYEIIVETTRTKLYKNITYTMPGKNLKIVKII